MSSLFTNNIRFFSMLILKAWTSTPNFSHTRWTLFVSYNCLGVNSAICTNKPSALAEELMVRLGARHLFQELIGSDTLSSKKPDPAPFIAAVTGSGGLVEQSLMVGDTSTDFDTAKAVGVPIIMVDFGFAGFDFSASKPDAILKSFLDLPEIVIGLLNS